VSGNAALELARALRGDALRLHDLSNNLSVTALGQLISADISSGARSLDAAARKAARLAPATGGTEAS